MELKDYHNLTIKVVKGNPYGIPKGKTFPARRKEGNGSPFPIEAFGDGIYQFKEDEVEILEERQDGTA
jgi:hypothetical protein